MTTFFVTLVLGYVFYASLIEWLLHRYVMHRSVGKFDYAYRAHALTHHKHYKADETYHEGDRQPSQKHLIHMAWWNGPVLTLLGSIPFLLISLATGIWPIWWGILLSLALYYVTYESFHWCMHLPKKRVLTYIWPIKGFFRRINGHHLLHHRYMGYNYNVVLPFWDWAFGTLILRAKTRFAQARDELLPDVQPIGMTPT
jgi:hypothetical protein